VVKDTAGFDFPVDGQESWHFVLAELSFSLPFSHVCPITSLDGKAGACALYTCLDMDALDLVTEKDGRRVVAEARRNAGGTGPTRRVCELLGGGDRREGEPEEEFWTEARELRWVPATWTLVKVPLTPARISIAETLRGVCPLRRYSAAGNLAWLASPESPQAMDKVLRGAGLSGLTIFGPPGKVRLGVRTGEAFERRVKSVFDPSGKFGEA
jgi:hypothetical protein